jgi:hypothetical protein
MEIRNLFDPNKDIYRTIEKVISYGASQEERLKAEISEYVVTESIEDQLEKLLSNMQAAMEAAGQNEVGVWVSGFYGSGKSSFTKYVGLAFDDRVTVDGQPFLRHLQDRLHKPQTKALLAAVARRFPVAVVLLDLASEQIAGATLEVVSSVLYYKVLQWAGYSRNLKVAAFERKLKKDGRYEEFLQLFEDTSGEPWTDYQNDQLVVDSLLPSLAHRMYPNFFATEQSFTTATSEIIYKLDDRIKEMLDIVREESGRDYILFVIDEVGQYISSSQNKILDLQGLAENMKNIGGGKAWIVSTAQQTLTEDDPRAALNSPELYKLKDRFRSRSTWKRGTSKRSAIAGYSANRLMARKNWVSSLTGKGKRFVITRDCKMPSTMTPTSVERHSQISPLPTSSFRHSAAPAWDARQVYWRRRPSLGDQGDSRHPCRGHRRPASGGEAAGWLLSHHRHAL